MDCPICRKPLTPFVGIEGEWMTCSASCNLVWIPAGKMDRIEWSNKEIREWVQTLGLKSEVASLPQKVTCPQCRGVILRQRFYSVKRQAQVCECAKCGGVLLSHKDLLGIPFEFSSEAERRQKTAQDLGQFFSQTASIHRVKSGGREASGAFRWLSPSWWFRKR